MEKQTTRKRQSAHIDDNAEKKKLKLEIKNKEDYEIHAVPLCSALEWWQTAVFYQIYPKSFKDNNNDGIGDLAGIIEKLDYLNDLGITAVWLSPIYKSPQVDAGYDISDYRDIDPIYGTMADFDKLMEKANKLGLKVVMDFVPNHSSDQHEWFKKSELKVPGYEDYYVWKDGKEDGSPPNNWVSVFKYSAWTFSKVRKQYYLHQFAPQQPDLNFRNPKVVEEILDVLTFWMNKGIAGFRVDAIPHCFEDELFRDEPIAKDTNAQPFEYGYLDHIYTKDMPETFELGQKMRDHVDKYASKHGGESRIIMTEAITSLPYVKKYYENGAHFSFNFVMIYDLNAASTAHDYVAKVREFTEGISNNYTWNWVLGNHDNHRLATRFGKEKVDGLNMFMAMLPGIGVNYNGEEIGMENGEVTFEEGQDPSAINGNKEDFDKVSRDFERTPFHWDDTVNAGFNTGAKPWLPVSKKYVENNLKAQMIPGVKSHYHVYRMLMRLRKNESLKTGEFWMRAFGNNVISIARKANGRTGYLYLFNIANTNQTINLNQSFNKLKKNFRISVSSINSEWKIGKHFNANEPFTLKPNEAIIAREC